MSVSSVEASICLSGYQGGFKDQAPGLPSSVRRHLCEGIAGGWACRREKPHLPSNTFPLQAEEVKMSKKTCLVFSPGTEGSSSASVSARLVIRKLN